ncbi:MAG: DNA internalization-related competence protein ComEC/Rec2 [Pseudomonadota bacterium]
MNQEHRSTGEIIGVRPTYIAVTAIVAGIIIGVQICGFSNYFKIPMMLLVLVFSIMSLASKSQAWSFTFIFLVFGLMGLLLSATTSTKTHLCEPSSDKVLIQATVARIISSSQSHRTILLQYGVLVETKSPLPGYGRFNLRDNSVPLSRGDRISFRSSLKTPMNRGNPGEYDWEIDCKNEGISWLASVRGEDFVAILKSGSVISPTAFVSNLRQAMSDFIEENSCVLFEVHDAISVRSIHKGIILGDRAEIDSELNRAFSRSGLVHMLSASGSHVTIVAAMTFFIVKCAIRLCPQILLWVPLQKIAALFCIPTVTIYCLLVGLKPPAMRAGMVGVTLAVAVISERRWDSLNSLAVAALAILLFYPLAIFTPSFQLSFAAVTGILLIIRSPAYARLASLSGNRSGLRPETGQPTNWVLRPFHYMARPILALTMCSLGATIAITPLIIHLFHRIPIYSLPANLAADVPLTLGLSLGLVSAFVGAILPSIGRIFMVPADFFVWIVIKIALFTESLPFSTIQSPNLGYPGFFISCATSVVTFYYLLKPRKHSGLIVASSWFIVVSFLLIGQTIQNHSEKLRVVFLNVVNGDAAYVRPPGASGFLIDTGPRTPYFDCGQSIIVPFLLWQAVSKLDAVMISHPDADHIGGTPSTIINFKPEYVLMNDPNNSNGIVRELRAIADKQNIPIYPSNSSMGSFSIGEVSINFLHPRCHRNQTAKRKTNDESVVTHIIYRNFSILFTGDLEKRGERELMASSEKLSSTVLKVPHHGGKTSATSKEILSEIRPKIAVISADHPAQRGLATQEVIERLIATGAKVFWTGRDGAITIETDGVKHVDVVTGKKNLRTTFLNVLNNSN